MVEVARPSDAVDNGALLTRLNGAPVLGCPLDHVTLLRLDRTGGLAPGNKAFKLRENLADARRRGVRRLVSFGGSWSNHLHALAAVAHQQGFESIGLVRGAERETAMLSDARNWGMRVVKPHTHTHRHLNALTFTLIWFSCFLNHKNESQKRVAK